MPIPPARTGYGGGSGKPSTTACALELSNARGFVSSLRRPAVANRLRDSGRAQAMSSVRPYPLVVRNRSHGHEHTSAARMNRWHGVPPVPHLVPIEGFARRTPLSGFLPHDSRPHSLSRVVAERRGPARERI